MAYTFKNKNVILNKGGGWEKRSSKGFFHPQDVAVLLSQPGVNGFMVENAEVNGVETLVLIGVRTKYDRRGNALIEEKFNRNNDIVALLCPPSDEPGGKFLATP